MPLDSTTPFDPFAAAGMVKQGTGGSSAPPATTQPAQPPGQQPPASSMPTITVTAPRPQQPPAPTTTSRQPPPAPAATAPPAAPAAPTGPPAVSGTVTAPAPTTAPPAPPAPPAPTFDPFTAGGLQKAPTQPATPAQPPATQPPAAETPWYQPILDFVYPSDPKGVEDSFNRDMAHSLFAGYDEDIAAAIGAPFLAYRKGISFSDAQAQLKAQLQADRHQLEEQHPYWSSFGSGTGMLTQALLSGNLYGTVAKGAPLATRALNYAGNIAMGATQGGLTSFGLSEGDLQQRLDDARKGAGWGALGSVAMPLLERLFGGIGRSLRPGAQVDRKAGEAILETTQGRTPTFEEAPIPNFPLGAGSATNEPGVAAMERTAQTIDNQRAVDIRTGQQQSVVSAATQPVTRPLPAMAPVATRPPPPVQLASGPMTPSEASGRLRDAFITAWNNVFKTEERRLWSTRNLLNVPLDVTNLGQNVKAALLRIPQRFQRAIARTPGLQDALDDLYRQPSNATLLDINDIRSDILKVARTADDAMVEMAGNRVADEILRAIERDPNIRGNPAVWSDYQAARRFTYDMWNGPMGKQPFQRMVDPDRDPRTLEGLFKFGPGISGERIPGGVADVMDQLDAIRTQWLALGGARFDPNVAQAARRELGQGAVDFIINSMIQPIAEARAGAETGHLNKLVQWINRNESWLVNSRLLAPEQMELLRNIAGASEMGARVGNLRGGRNSATFERVMSGTNPRIIDLFSTALNKHLFIYAGGAIGSLMEHLTGLGIGALLGLGAEGLGLTILHRMYEMPAQQLRQRLIEAAQNPDIARDLIRRANDFRNVSEATQRWLRSLGADTGAHFQYDISPTTPLSQSTPLQ